MPSDELTDADPFATQEPVEVPWQELSAAALRGVVEAFVLREGTDYGAVEASFEDKVAAVLAQVEQGEAQIVFDPASRSVEIALVTRLRRR
jgi:uncharacterized protein YheU (UPF0270 family)